MAQMLVDREAPSHIARVMGVMVLTERFGPHRVSASGERIALVGTAPFALLPFSALPKWAICASLFIRRMGLGAINIPLVSARLTHRLPEKPSQLPRLQSISSNIWAAR